MFGQSYILPREKHPAPPPLRLLPHQRVHTHRPHVHADVLETPDAVPARVTLGVTSLLTVITKQYQARMPSVSYVVALNIWLSNCIAFVFFSLLELATVVALSTKTPSEGDRHEQLLLMGSDVESLWHMDHEAVLVPP
ncbi:hypothetical protein JTE90_017536 [Oedothorax gibbosus]|uniref:Neurotransmitter-gated ion-channel transmembrane domain-containing protein n=1 Tax=Oedothorax gibbosus TaxID=931172 RepID=A0AAV6TQG9_9ARAC|nr:hypothetical protein JTE90_017536 [Oedothorax gibbosus]